MQAVLNRAGGFSAFLYLVVGVVGHLCFAGRQDQLMLDSHNVLEADFGGSPMIDFARYMVLVSVIAAAPLSLLPAKGALEQVVCASGTKFSGVQNLFVSLLMVTLCYMCAIFVPNLGMVIAITGATVNPFIGFLFPIMFYLKLGDVSTSNRRRALSILVGIVAVSVLGLI